MDKSFNVRPRITGLFQIRQGQFTGRNYPDDAVLRRKTDPGGSGHRHLGGSVKGQVRNQFPRRPDDAHILYDDAVNTHIMQKDQIILQLRQFLIIHQSIHRHIKADMVHVAKINGLSHFLPVKIAGVGPGPEGLPAQIHRISPGVHRRFQSFPRSRGSQ